ncbi:MAG: hypothetical protein VB858_08195, partial [Planctomycetaceae bacterium]
MVPRSAFPASPAALPVGRTGTRRTRVRQLCDAAAASIPFRAGIQLLAGLVATTACAGPMTRNLESVMPRIGQQGTTVDVRIQGVSLARPEQ